MAASRPKPHIRVIIGRNITLTAAAIYALARAGIYATINPADLNEGMTIITANGRLLGLWAALWATGAILCVADMINRHTRWGLSLVISAAMATGIIYAGIWAFTGFTGHAWIISAIGWLAPATMVAGYLLKVTALQDMLNPATAEEEDE